MEGGVVILGAGTKGKVLTCDVFGNAKAGIQVSEGADPTVEGCKCDHTHSLSSLSSLRLFFILES